LCYSRILFFQFFPTFTRFDCKVFLSDALQYFQGSCDVCMIDNTHVVVLQGTGRDMVPVPEMAAFAERYRFRFQAHEKGDANRSAHVERGFSYIENNFLAGRSYRSHRCGEDGTCVRPVAQGTTEWLSCFVHQSARSIR